MDSMMDMLHAEQTPWVGDRKGDQDIRAFDFDGGSPGSSMQVTSAFLPAGDGGWPGQTPSSAAGVGGLIDSGLSGGGAGTSMDMDMIDMLSPPIRGSSRRIPSALGLGTIRDRGREEEDEDALRGSLDHWGVGILEFREAGRGTGGGVDIASLFRVASTATEPGAMSYAAFDDEAPPSHTASHCDYWGDECEDGKDNQPGEVAAAGCDHIDMSPTPCDQSSPDLQQRDHGAIEATGSPDDDGDDPAAAHIAPANRAGDERQAEAVARSVVGYLASLPLRAVQRMLYEGGALKDLTKIAPSHAIVRYDSILVCFMHTLKSR
jgi:hypothetical protein